MYRDVPVHHYTCSVYFFFLGITWTLTFQLPTGVPTNRTPENVFTCLPSCFSFVKPQRPTCHHIYLHRCTHSGPYAFIFILSFQLTIKIYPSTVILFYMSTDIPVHQYTCSVYFLFFGMSYTMTFQFVFWGTYPQIHLEINLPVYPHASLSSNHKDLPVTTTTCVPAHICTHYTPVHFHTLFQLTI